jgi:hypothetical protein
MAAVLRPCEIRAFNELVKLNQGKRDDVVIIGLDCPGALSNSDFRDFADQHETSDAATRAFCATAFSGEPGDAATCTVTAACRACDHPIPDGADIVVELFGADPAGGLTVRSRTPKREKPCSPVWTFPSTESGATATQNRHQQHHWSNASKTGSRCLPRWRTPPAASTG